MFRRSFSLFLIVVCLLACPTRAQTDMPVETEKVGAAIVMEAQSGVALMSSAASDPLPVAGLARLPALLLICEAFDAGKVKNTDLVRVSDKAASIKGPTAFLSPGEEMAAGELLKCAVMIMAGDALYALGEAVSGAEETFVQNVNRRLEGLGVSAVYTDRLGSGVAMSVTDIAKVGAALSQSKAFSAYGMLYYDSISHQSGLVTELASGNKLLRSYPGCEGIATGSSAEAGYCGVYCVRRSEQTLLCAILGAKDAGARNRAATAMLDHAFATFQVKTLAHRGEAFAQDIPVEGGVEDACTLVAFANVTAVFPADQTAYTKKEEIPQTLQAPLRAGDVLGRISYVDPDGGVLACVELTVAADIPQAGWKDHFARAIHTFLHA